MKGKGMSSIKLRAVSLVLTSVIAAFGTLSSAYAVVGGKSVRQDLLQNPNLQVLGPVENIDVPRGALEVAGQTILVARGTQFSAAGAAMGSPVSSLQMIQLGDLVAVFGRVGASPTAIVRVNSAYVAGSTRIFVKGRITSVDPAVGQARINSLIVDYTAAMSGSTFSAPNIGNLVSVSGIQPVADGELLVDRLAHVSVTNMAGTSSIIGTGLRSMSIIGTGASANSIIGTGSQATSIIGTGNNRASSIIGTGSQDLSIIGTGSRATSIIGTGANANSIIGTGASANSIIGTGSQATSIIGTGASANSIIGTGSQATSIIGTGANANSIIGTGARIY